jgi:hypothetical protein
VAVQDVQLFMLRMGTNEVTAVNAALSVVSEEAMQFVAPSQSMKQWRVLIQLALPPVDALRFMIDSPTTKLGPFLIVLSHTALAVPSQSM